MTANSLYGRLAADLAIEYRLKSDALHAHPQLINRFDEAIKPFALTPHVKPSPAGGISLCATSSRGENATVLIAAMQAAGFQIGEAIRLPHQFNDGYVMWTAFIRADGIEFTLLFYTEVEAI